MSPIILFRKGYGERDEHEIAAKYFKVVPSRMECPSSLVVARYSCLPFYRELERDLSHCGSGLINSYDAHCWIADFAYYRELREFTPRSYDTDNFWSAPEGAYVVKGRTNSRKHQWSKRMFAADKRQAIQIAGELRDDALIAEQGIIYRDFVPLKPLGVDEISGITYSNEWRFFYYGKTLLSYGYYWSTAEEDVIKSAYMTQEGLDFAQRLADIACEYVDFYVLDIAEKRDGGWILVEMNDAQMSGLSENNPDVLYGNLRKALDEGKDVRNG